MQNLRMLGGSAILLQILASAFLAILFLQSGIDRRALLRATDGKGLRRSSCARSLFFAGAQRNVSARIEMM